MKKVPDDSVPPIFVGPSGNPYARIQNDDDDLHGRKQLSIAFEAPRPTLKYSVPIKSSAESRDIGSGNPYAALGAMDESEWDQQGSTSSRAMPASTISKKDFSSEARRIFLQYTPKLEAGRLRPQYIEFIQRNSTRSSEERYRVLERLKRYDLKSAGVSGYFNREDNEISSQKLAEIEKLD